MPNSLRLETPTVICLLLLASPTLVIVHVGHGNEFHQGSDTAQTTNSIQVDADADKRLGIKVESVQRQQLAIGIKTTGYRDW